MLVHLIMVLLLQWVSRNIKACKVIKLCDMFYNFNSEHERFYDDIEESDTTHNCTLFASSVADASSSSKSPGLCHRRVRKSL